MITWRHRLLGFLTIFVAALMGVLAAEYLINRCAVLAPLLDPSQDYNKVVLLESRVQSAGVYVRYRNAGDKTLTAANFKFKYYEQGQLVEESDEWYMEQVPAGQWTEGLITPKRFQGDQVTPIPLGGRTVKVLCTGGNTKED